MPRLPVRARASGFTLLEVLVVMVIVGIIASMAVISVNVLGRDREMDQEARRLQAVLGQAREDAMLEGRDLGFRIDARGYDFVRYDARKDRWDTIPGDPLLRERSWPDGLEAELWLESRLVQLQARSAAPAETSGTSADKTDKGTASNTTSDTAKDGTDDSDMLRPQVVVQASGDLVPFEIRFKRGGSEESRVVSGAADGDIAVTDPNADKVR